MKNKYKSLNSPVNLKWKKKDNTMDQIFFVTLAVYQSCAKAADLFFGQTFKILDTYAANNNTTNLFLESVYDRFQK